ncbi:hypothetical protein A4U88_3977 [Serratia marcescens]|nr:hypothetical protein A4U88_3977 [Serratia marcescens]
MALSCRFVHGVISAVERIKQQYTAKRSKKERPSAAHSASNIKKALGG